MSVLFIDTDGEVWHSVAKELGVNVIKMPYILDGKEYYDDVGETVDYRDFYNAIRNGASAKTAALNQQDYLEYFEPYFAKGEEILYVSFSSKLSATFSFMDSAVAELSAKYPEAKFTRFDTLSIAMGAGFQMYYAAKMWRSGASVAQIVDYLNVLTQNVKTYFVVDDLNHLKKGGRVSPTLAFVGGLLGIKPVLKITDKGTIDKVETVKGSRKVLSYLCELVCQHGTDFDNYDIWIVHADCEEQAIALREMLVDKIPNAKVNIQIVGPVIGSHCGPGTIGVIFHSNCR